MTFWETWHIDNFLQFLQWETTWPNLEQPPPRFLECLNARADAAIHHWQEIAIVFYWQFRKCRLGLAQTCNANLSSHRCSLVSPTFQTASKCTAVFPCMVSCLLFGSRSPSSHRISWFGCFIAIKYFKKRKTIVSSCLYLKSWSAPLDLSPQLSWS